MALELDHPHVLELCHDCESIGHRGFCLMPIVNVLSAEVLYYRAPSAVIKCPVQFASDCPFCIDFVCTEEVQKRPALKLLFRGLTLYSTRRVYYTNRT